MQLWNGELSEVGGNGRQPWWGQSSGGVTRTCAVQPPGSRPLETSLCGPLLAVMDFRLDAVNRQVVVWGGGNVVHLGCVRNPPAMQEMKETQV